MEKILEKILGTLILIPVALYLLALLVANTPIVYLLLYLLLIIALIVMVSGFIIVITWWVKRRTSTLESLKNKNNKEMVIRIR